MLFVGANGLVCHSGKSRGEGLFFYSAVRPLFGQRFTTIIGRWMKTCMYFGKISSYFRFGYLLALFFR
jgi:hypothetical protein